MPSIRNDWRRITELVEQPVLRNLLVTQGYHELSRDFARMLGPENVTWFSFASWSSKSVGSFLQNDQLPHVLRRVLVERPRDSVLPAAIRGMRSYLSLGNTEVFGELAPVFGNFLDTFGADGEADYDKLENYLATLRDGPSEPDRVQRDPETRALEFVARAGQSRLREAMRQYYRAKFEADPKRKAEHVLLANAYVGVHEQTRLQTYISGALELPLPLPRRTLDADDAAAAARESRWPLATRESRWLSEQARVMFRRFATERLLTLKLPDSLVRLGRDLSAAPGHPLVPKLLEQFEHPELGAVFAQYGRPTSPGTAAADWTSLRQRMRFILALFRSRQRNQRLLEPTFSAPQVAMLERRSVPAGPLS